MTSDPQVAPPEIEPDTKDWTWVLDERCPECGFAALDVAANVAIAATVRTLAPRWVGVLSRSDARERPEPSVWSVLEYGAHVRDVHLVFGARLVSMLEHDDPLFENWDQDAAAVADRYDLQSPAVVASELADVSDALADAFDGVEGEEWDRPGRRSNGSVFTVSTLGLYFLHDVIHHLHDVGA
ncbi:MAG: DinB family protein [Cellulomonas sp.]|uniref:DinB family protein n=1 Tax=Cellulomonas sp. TaxID=40001 RepID=UPI0017DDE5DC|nr:DinB family protein [Cellulomonas sp.]NMM15864.1 DinB family protein [Cellulomonas sp.]NMM31672.1 DinB family protein [Cellulomonas sp.]